MAATPTDKVRFGAGLVGLVALSSIAWLVLWTAVASLMLGWSPVAVLSGSMAPRIDSGDIVVAAPYQGQELGPGAVIVFDSHTSDGRITHRIVDVLPSGEYVTRGDANGRIDTTAVAADDVVGVGRLLVPFLGMPFVWLDRGQWEMLVLAVIAIAAAAWMSRWALLDKYDPWKTRIEIPNIRLLTQRHTKRISPMVIVVLASLLVVAATTTRSRAAYADFTGNSGSAFSADILQPPAGLTGACGATINLNWTATPDAYPTGHRVMRSDTTGGPYTQIASVTPRTVTTYGDTPAAGSYYYVVRAYYLNWISADSNEISVATSCSTTVSFGANKDSEVDQDKPGDNYGTEIVASVRTESSKNARGLFSFDVSSIPAGAVIDSATLTLCPSRADDPSVIDVRRVTGTWGETTVTWNNQPTVAGSSTTTFAQPATTACVDATVTVDVQAWVDGTANNGWRLAHTVENQSSRIRIEYSTREDSDAAQRPLLVVVYH